MDLTKPVKITVCGFNQSGKSTYVKWLLSQYDLPIFVYDWHGEYKMLGEKVFVYIPSFRGILEERLTELNEVLQKFVLDKKDIIKMIVIDEANEYCPNHRPLPRTILDLYNNHAHYNQSMITISRRPSDLSSKLMELAHYRIFFKLFGKNDMIYLDALKSGLSNIVSELQPFHYAVLDYKGEVSVYPAIQMSR